jgi:hypothetical protein
MTRRVATVGYRVRLVCTDRGRHRRWVLGHARLVSSGWVHVNPPTLQCALCPRHPERRQEAWQAAMPGLRDAGITEVDISYLPF